MISKGNSILRDAYLALLRAIIATSIPAATAVIFWYIHKGFSVMHHIDISGAFAVLVLAALALYTLQSHIYRTYGRATICAFALWSFTSTIWRIFAIMHWINPEERLLLNTIVAWVIAFAGIYTLFLHRLAVKLWIVISSTSNGPKPTNEDRDEY